MPRAPREDYPGAWHHVMNRGSARRAIYRDTGDRIVFLNILSSAAAKSSTQVHAYCLMNNHFHLLIHSVEGHLPRFLQHLTGRYALHFNRRHALDGPLFKGRCVSVAVNDDAQLLSTSRYIHLNPVVAGLIENAEDWPWSSAAVFLDKVQKPDWLVVQALHNMFSNTAPGFKYASYLADGIDEATSRRFTELGL
jgi:putative transposase